MRLPIRPRASHTCCSPESSFRRLSQAKTSSSVCGGHRRHVLGQKNWLNRHGVLDVQVFENGLQVPHERSSPLPSSSPILPVRPVFHPHDQVDSVLILHLVNVDSHPIPLSVIVQHVLLQSDFELFDDLRYGSVNDRATATKLTSRGVS